MRRTKMAALGMVMVLSMAACVGRAETTAEGATMKSMEMDSGESEENMIGMPNPYTDHDTLKEAEEDAGFKIQVPDEIRGVKAAAFRNLGAKLLEVIYYDGENEVARVRKGIGAEDISGDYVIYSEVKTVEVGGKICYNKERSRRLLSGCMEPNAGLEQSEYGCGTGGCCF